jgi:NADH:ubiquinone oxidoreductase subunit E
MTNKKIQYKPIAHEIEALAQEHGYQGERILEMLAELDRRSQLNPENITDTARALGIPAHHAYGVATFYSMDRCAG